MRCMTIALIALLMPFSAMSCEAPTPAEKAGESWLALVDTKQYSESWLAASFEFQKLIGQANWADAVGPMRERLGKVINRKIGNVTRTNTLPGLPDGEFTIIEYHTMFANKTATETLTMILDKDTPKVGGYFIK